MSRIEAQLFDSFLPRLLEDALDGSGPKSKIKDVYVPKIASSNGKIKKEVEMRERIPGSKSDSSQEARRKSQEDRTYSSGSSPLKPDLVPSFDEAPVARPQNRVIPGIVGAPPTGLTDRGKIVIVSPRMADRAIDKPQVRGGVSGGDALKVAGAAVGVATLVAGGIAVANSLQEGQGSEAATPTPIVEPTQNPISTLGPEPTGPVIIVPSQEVTDQPTETAYPKGAQGPEVATLPGQESMIINKWGALSGDDIPENILNLLIDTSTGTLDANGNQLTREQRKKMLTDSTVMILGIFNGTNEDGEVKWVEFLIPKFDENGNLKFYETVKSFTNILNVSNEQPTEIGGTKVGTFWVDGDVVSDAGSSDDISNRVEVGQPVIVLTNSPRAATFDALLLGEFGRREGSVCGSESADAGVCFTGGPWRIVATKPPGI